MVAIVMHPKDIAIADFTYSLPGDRIASYPLQKRDSSKLLVYRNGDIQDDIYENIASHIPTGSLLIFNNTKVVEARLLFQKPTGGVIEIFCLEPHEQYADITTAMLQRGKVYWLCLVGGASKWKHGQILQKIIYAFNKEIILEAIYQEKRIDSFVIELSWNDPEMSFAELLHHAGAIPLPPYIKRKAESSDAERYQTIYARYDGSVAAPTAGLHFTDSIFRSLDRKNIQKEFVTLHVGAGTFKPVKSETMQQHEMHAEFIDVSGEAIENIIRHLDKTIIPVGTTSMRTIESLYWLGVKLLTANDQSSIPELNQWEAYDMPSRDVQAKDALASLLGWMKKNKLKKLVTRTRIIIAPGYKLRIAKGLITNFHQPQSTLLLLIAAIIGEDWRKVYDHALQNGFRFLSYGDGCLLYPQVQE
ncbi:S-adenosylmethionine:tRNA ribosyltransferase-isomerase [Terrimonas alba]|uniref:S-adenosylmethionine:tRNA ribosyltransferase-isomerase n=1 Tax=Terrimonas alba TaxID=3349636 RepID=UPI0035F335D8